MASDPRRARSDPTQPRRRLGLEVRPPPGTPDSPWARGEPQMSLAPRPAAQLMLGAPPRCEALASRGTPVSLVPLVSPGTPLTLAMRRPEVSRLRTRLGTRMLLTQAERLGPPMQPTLRSTRPSIPHRWQNHHSRCPGRQGGRRRFVSRRGTRLTRMRATPSWYPSQIRPGRASSLKATRPRTAAEQATVRIAAKRWGRHRRPTTCRAVRMRLSPRIPNRRNRPLSPATKARLGPPRGSRKDKRTSEMAKEPRRLHPFPNLPPGNPLTGASRRHMGPTPPSHPMSCREVLRRGPALRRLRETPTAHPTMLHRWWRSRPGNPRARPGLGHSWDLATQPRR